MDPYEYARNASYIRAPIYSLDFSVSTPVFVTTGDPQCGQFHQVIAVISCSTADAYAASGYHPWNQFASCIMAFSFMLPISFGGDSLGRMKICQRSRENR